MPYDRQAYLHGRFTRSLFAASAKERRGTGAATAGRIGQRPYRPRLAVGRGLFVDCQQPGLDTAGDR